MSNRISGSRSRNRNGWSHMGILTALLDVNMGLGMSFFLSGPLPSLELLRWIDFQRENTPPMLPGSQGFDRLGIPELPFSKSSHQEDLRSASLVKQSGCSRSRVSFYQHRTRINWRKPISASQILCTIRAATSPFYAASTRCLYQDLSHPSKPSPHPSFADPASVLGPRPEGC
jgi:hypothetical protein